MQFLIPLGKFIKDNRARAVGEFELSTPRWYEDPKFVLEILQKYLETNHGPIFNQSKNDSLLSKIGNSLPPFKKWILSQLVESYSRYSIFRDKIKYRLIEGYAELRKAILELGANLVVNNYIDDVNDIFYLTPHEALNYEDIFSSKSKTDIIKLINERKEQNTLWETLNAPDLIDSEGHKLVTKQNDEFIGIACSPGIAEGKARVLFDNSELDDFEPGEILITHHTDPGWAPLFLSCNAIVSEIGGFLSHGATIAREHSIPAVFNIEGLTQKIQTGDFVRVDGTNGIIEVINDNNK